MRVIQLTQGQVAIVDDEDFQELAQYRWHYKKASKGYPGCAARNVTLLDGRQTTVRMHRVILGLPPGRNPEGEHKNGNSLDNRRENLRVATRTENVWNRGAFRRNKLGLKGVWFNKKLGKFQSKITANGTINYLGVFDTAEEAKAAYDKEAVVLHGEFVRLN